MKPLQRLIGRTPGGGLGQPLGLRLAGLGLRRRPRYMGLTATGPTAGVSATAVPTAAAWSADRWSIRKASTAWRRFCTR